MSTEKRIPVARGKRNPTSVWIASNDGKNGRSYRIRWVDPRTGRTMSEACGHDKALARTRRDAKKAELRDGLTGRLPDKSIADLRDALPEFMTGKSPHTVRKAKGSLDSLVALCGDRRLVQVDRGFIMEFRSKRATNAAVATVNKDLRQIKSALSYAVDAGWLRANPMWRWKGMQLRESEKRIRVVEPAEFQRLLDACPDPAFRMLMATAYYQGCRRTELANLRWTAVDCERGVLRVENLAEYGEFTKSRKNRTLPMREAVRTGLRALYDGVPKVVEGGAVKPKHPHCFTWADGKPYRPDAVTHRFAEIRKAAGIAACTLHDLRRSFSTLAQRAGIDKATVKDLGGWSTIGVVEKHYTGETPEVFQRAMARLETAEGVA
jgi:integrase